MMIGPFTFGFNKNCSHSYYASPPFAFELGLLKGWADFQREAFLSNSVQSAALREKKKGGGVHGKEH